MQLVAQPATTTMTTTAQDVQADTLPTVLVLHQPCRVRWEKLYCMCEALVCAQGGQTVPTLPVCTSHGITHGRFHRIQTEDDDVVTAPSIVSNNHHTQQHRLTILDDTHEDDQPTYRVLSSPFLEAGNNDVDITMHNHSQRMVCTRAGIALCIPARTEFHRDAVVFESLVLDPSDEWDSGLAAQGLQMRFQLDHVAHCVHVRLRIPASLAGVEPERWSETQYTHDLTRHYPFTVYTAAERTATYPQMRWWVMANAGDAVVVRSVCGA